ncbi:hypothetical protein JQ624_37310 [Bradyrhizobium sp. AUGA SZCCT0283]|nr:hypothetical protein [Bradyrhizobium sp. AUGA SZCCT0283]
MDACVAPNICPPLSTLTLHLGFDFDSDEYKIMGLAPYGDPARYQHFFEQAVELLDNGLIRISLLRSGLIANACPIRLRTHRAGAAPCRHSRPGRSP